MKKTFITLFAVIIATSMISVTKVEGANTGVYDWKATIWISDGTENNKLDVGASDKATDGYDPIFEKDAYTAGYVRPYFYHPEWNRSSMTGGTDYYWSDVRSSTLPQSFSFKVEAYRTSVDVELTWDLKKLNSNVCASKNLLLIDNSTGASTNLNDLTSYTYFSTSTSPRTFTLNVSEDITDVANASNLSAVSAGSNVIVSWDSSGSNGYVITKSVDGSSAVSLSDALITDEDSDGKITYIDSDFDSISTPTKSRRGRGNSASTSSGSTSTVTYTITAVDSNSCTSSESTVEVIR